MAASTDNVSSFDDLVADDASWVAEEPPLGVTYFDDSDSYLLQSLIIFRIYITHIESVIRQR